MPQTDEEIIAEGSKIILPATARRPYPVVRLVITKERMATAKRANSYNCMITDEFRALMEGSDIHVVRTDRALIRAYNRKLNLNLAWETPRDVAGRLDLWDDGVSLKAYYFYLRRPDKITRHGGTGRPRGRLKTATEDDRREHTRKRKREYATKTRSIRKVALNPDAAIQVGDYAEAFQNPNAQLGPAVIVPDPLVDRKDQWRRRPVVVGGRPQKPTRGLKHLRRFGFGKADADKWVDESELDPEARV